MVSLALHQDDMSRWNWCTTENQAHSETEFLTCQTKLPANYPQGRHSLYACLLTTVFVSSETLCTVVMHVSCCLSTIPVTNMWWCCFCKSKEKLPWVNRCGPFSYKMQINIAQHCVLHPTLSLACSFWYCCCEGLFS